MLIQPYTRILARENPSTTPLPHPAPTAILPPMDPCLRRDCLPAWDGTGRFPAAPAHAPAHAAEGVADWRFGSPWH
jgi:hypothetical protein